MPEGTHQLAAIMFTDIVGYTRTMGENEAHAFKLLAKNKSIQQPLIRAYRGKVIKEMGDGLLASFNSAIDAVMCGNAIQHRLMEDPELNIRIGIHVGDVVFKEGDVFGDGVNIASRIEAIAPTGEILVSDSVYKSVKNKEGLNLEFVKEEVLKNVNEPIRVYKVSVETIEGMSFHETVKTITHTRKRSLPRRAIYGMIAAVVVAGIAYLFYNIGNKKLQKSVPIDAAENSIAVLPFINMSSDPEQLYFCNGMTDQIITNLAKIHSLKVIGRSTIMQYEDTEKTVPEIASELNVSHVLEGTIQMSGNRIRVNAQMTRAADDIEEWAEVYTYEIADIFVLQDTISHMIATALMGELSSEEKRIILTEKPANIEAYDYYLQGVHIHIEELFHSRSQEDFHRAEEMFLKAIEADPQFASAYGGLADMYDTYSFEDRSYWHLRDSVVQIGYRLNPNSIDVLVTMGLSFLNRVDPNIDSAFIYLKKAYDVNPNNAMINNWIGSAYSRIGLMENAKTMYRRVLTLNPVDLDARQFLAYAQLLSGEIRDSEENFNAVLAMDPDFLGANYGMSLIDLFFKNDVASAQSRYEIMVEANPSSRYTTSTQSLLLVKQNDFEKAVALTDELLVYALMKAEKETIEKLDSLVHSSDALGTYINITSNIALDFIREEPEYHEIVKRSEVLYKDRKEKFGKLFD